MRKRYVAPKPVIFGTSGGHAKRDHLPPGDAHHPFLDRLKQELQSVALRARYRNDAVILDRHPFGTIDFVDFIPDRDDAVEKRLRKFEGFQRPVNVVVLSFNVRMARVLDVNQKIGVDGVLEGGRK